MSSARWSTVAASAIAALTFALLVLRRGFGRLDAALDSPLPEPAFVAVAQIVTACGGCWLAVGTLCVLLEEAPWRRSGTARRIEGVLPRGWRAAVLAAAGTGLLGGPALASAAAAAVHAPADQRPHSPSAGFLAVLNGLALPDRASGGLHRPSAVVVSRGDCLWSFAAAALPSTATNASIARHTDRWYRANVDVIGADPDLLLPGIRLHPPGTHS